MADLADRDYVGDLRRAREESHPFPYEALHSADRWHAGRQQLADSIISGSWQWKGHRSIALDVPVEWDWICAENRSWALALHSWEPLAPLIAAYDRLSDVRYLDFALTLATDWIEQFKAIGEPRDSLAWYDLAVGARTYRLAYLLDVVARDERRENQLVRQLLRSLLLHAEALADDDRFARHSNHGLYQVMGQLAMSRRFPDIADLKRAGQQGMTRLHEILEDHFTKEGVHCEHSPHYHSLMLIPLRALWRAGLVRSRRLKLLLRQSENALAWFVTPAGRYAMFGDTSRQSIADESLGAIESEQLRFVLSRGRVGTPPKANLRGFPESGYVVFRDQWPTRSGSFSDCAYLAQSCAFHSRVHKHADDLSFVWYDQGCDILTDAGRFGYVGKTAPASELFAQGFWYSDPRRIYVESTSAHNTVEIDDRSNTRRGIEPYRSALRQWGESGPVCFAESRVEHGSLSHTRLLMFRPHVWLVVVDVMAELEAKRHNFVQRFHLAPEIDLINNPRNEEGKITARLPTGERLDAMPLLPSQASVLPVRGETEPRLLGWISPCDGDMEPQWTFGWSATGVRSHVFASLFCFPNRRSRAELGDNQIDQSGMRMQLGWTLDGTGHLLEVERVAEGPPDIRYATRPNV